MSIWYYKKETDGTKSLTALDIPFLAILIVVGLLAALVGPLLFGSPSRIIRMASCGILIGYILLFISKVSLFSKGLMFSWGYSQMSKGFRMIYVAGYVLMVNGVLVLFAVYRHL